jgi:monoamine oxidase
VSDRTITGRELVGGAAAGAALLALDANPAAAAPPRRRRGTRRAGVAIVGGGLAGLTGAHRLAAAGRSVVVLEARQRVGGRTLNANLGGGHVTELGGQFIGPTQNRIAALAKAVGVATFPTYNTGLNVSDITGQRLPYPAVPGIATDPDVAAALIQSLKLDELAKQVPVAAPWTARNAAALDRQALAGFRDANIASPRGRAAFDAICQANWGAEASEMSLLFALAYVAAAGDEKNRGSFLRLITTGGGARESRFVGGSQVVSQKVADRLGGRVVLGTPVRRIVQDSDGVGVIASGLTVSARRAVVAVPPVLALDIVFSPVLPRAKARILRGLRPGHLVKAEAVYPRPFLAAQDAGGRVGRRTALRPAVVGPVLLDVADRAPGRPRRRTRRTRRGLPPAAGRSAGRGAGARARRR